MAVAGVARVVVRGVRVVRRVEATGALDERGVRGAGVAQAREARKLRVGLARAVAGAVVGADGTLAGRALVVVDVGPVRRLDHVLVAVQLPQRVGTGVPRRVDPAPGLAARARAQGAVRTRPGRLHGVAGVLAVHNGDGAAEVHIVRGGPCGDGTGASRRDGLVEGPVVVQQMEIVAAGGPRARDDANR